jgi:hypothetical protein
MLARIARRLATGSLAVAALAGIAGVAPAAAALTLGGGVFVLPTVTGSCAPGGGTVLSFAGSRASTPLPGGFGTGSINFSGTVTAAGPLSRASLPEVDSGLLTSATFGGLTVSSPAGTASLTINPASTSTGTVRCSDYSHVNFTPYGYPATWNNVTGSWREAAVTFSDYDAIISPTSGTPVLERGRMAIDCTDSHFVLSPTFSLSQGGCAATFTVVSQLAITSAPAVTSQLLDATGTPPSISSVQFVSADAHYVAYQDPDLGVVVQDTVTGVSTSFFGAYPAMSTGGRYVSYYYGGQEHLYDRVTNTHELVSLDGSGAPLGGDYGSAVSADGRYVAFIDASTGALTPYLRDRTTSTTLRLADSSSTDQLTMSDDGGTITWPGGDGIHVWQRATGTVTTVANADARGPVVSGDGRIVTWYGPLTPAGDVYGLVETTLATGADHTVWQDTPTRQLAGLVSSSRTGQYLALLLEDIDGAGNSDGSGSIYRLDTTTGDLLSVSITPDGNPALVQSGTAIVAGISGDGTAIAFGSSSGLLLARIGSGSGSVTPPPPTPVDANGDGVDDVLQPAGVGAGGFRDSRTPPTTGAIVSRNGLTVRIADAPDPLNGVQVSVGPGSGYAALSVCGFAVRASANSLSYMTCGSLSVRVLGGTVDVDLGGGITDVTVAAPVVAKITDVGAGAYSVQSLYGGDVRVATNGVVQTVAAGRTTTVAVVTLANLCGLTRLDVTTSARYRALPPGTRLIVDALATAACNQLAAVTPRLSAKQKAALIAAYKSYVAQLLAGGWITADQAATLRALADRV